MASNNSGISTLYSSQFAPSLIKNCEYFHRRISSCKRINHAGDDAAGGAIASRMTAQIKNEYMSVVNASDTWFIS